MTRQAPRLAVSLLHRYAPENEPLVGDIIETFADRPSQIWLWSQVIAVAGASLLRRDSEVRPLKLVDHQPLDAIQRTVEMHRRYRDISPTPNPLPAGLGLVILGGLVTALAPIVWWGLLTTLVIGIAFARLLIIAHERRSPPSSARRLT